MVCILSDFDHIFCVLFKFLVVKCVFKTTFISLNWMLKRDQPDPVLVKCYGDIK